MSMMGGGGMMTELEVGARRDETRAQDRGRSVGISPRQSDHPRDLGAGDGARGCARCGHGRNHRLTRRGDGARRGLGGRGRGLGTRCTDWIPT